MNCETVRNYTNPLPEKLSEFCGIIENQKKLEAEAKVATKKGSKTAKVDVEKKGVEKAKVIAAAKFLKNYEIYMQRLKKWKRTIAGERCSNIYFVWKANLRLLKLDRNIQFYENEISKLEKTKATINSSEKEQSAPASELEKTKATINSPEKEQSEPASEVGKTSKKRKQSKHSKKHKEVAKKLSQQDRLSKEVLVKHKKVAKKLRKLDELSKEVATKQEKVDRLKRKRGGIPQYHVIGKSYTVMGKNYEVIRKKCILAEPAYAKAQSSRKMLKAIQITLKTIQEYYDKENRKSFVVSDTRKEPLVKILEMITRYSTAKKVLSSKGDINTQEDFWSLYSNLAEWRTQYNKFSQALQFRNRFFPSEQEKIEMPLLLKLGDLYKLSAYSWKKLCKLCKNLGMSFPIEDKDEATAVKVLAALKLEYSANHVAVLNEIGTFLKLPSGCRFLAIISKAQEEAFQGLQMKFPLEDSHEGPESDDTSQKLAEKVFRKLGMKADLAATDSAIKWANEFAKEPSVVPFRVENSFSDLSLTSLKNLFEKLETYSDIFKAVNDDFQGYILNDEKRAKFIEELGKAGKLYRQIRLGLVALFQRLTFHAPKAAGYFKFKKEQLEKHLSENSQWKWREVIEHFDMHEMGDESFVKAWALDTTLCLSEKEIAKRNETIAKNEAPASQKFNPKKGGAYSLIYMGS